MADGHADRGITDTHYPERQSLLHEIQPHTHTQKEMKRV